MIRLRQTAILLIAGTLLTACSTTPRAELSRLPLPAPAPIQTKEVEWKVLHKGDAADQDYFVLSPDQFDKLVDNQADILRWVKEAVGQLTYYTAPPKASKDKTK